MYRGNNLKQTIMKLRLLFSPLMLVGLLAVAGCHDDEDHIQVTPEMNNAFNSMFPDSEIARAVTMWPNSGARR